MPFIGVRGKRELKHIPEKKAKRTRIVSNKKESLWLSADTEKLVGGDANKKKGKSCLGVEVGEGKNHRRYKKQTRKQETGKKLRGVAT